MTEDVRILDKTLITEVSDILELAQKSLEEQVIRLKSEIEELRIKSERDLLLDRIKQIKEKLE
jgi:hypothetical protein